MIGRAVAHFRIIDKLGEGGMGEVFKAEDTKLGRAVALKFLSSDLAGDSAASERFLREARAIAGLNHPHICTIYETGDLAGRPFFAMEYLKGHTLRAALGDGPLSRESFLTVALQLADALGQAHSNGILHRDLKPENVFIGEKTHVKLLDFGLAKALLQPSDTLESAPITSAPETTTAGRPPSPAERTIPALTVAGTMLGTVAYMSPEQARNDPLDARSDLFSLGSVLYEMATGRPAFARDTTMSTLAAIMAESPKLPPEVRGAIPKTITLVIERLLEKDPDRRFRTCSDVRDALMGSTIAKGPIRPSESAALPTLGVKRSTAHAWIFKGGIGLGAAWLILNRGSVTFGREGDLLGILSLVLLFITPIVWWIGLRRGAREVAAFGAGLVRYQEPPESPRSWILLRLFMVLIAVTATANAVFVASVRGPNPTRDFDLGWAMAVSACAWAAIIASRGWQKRRRTRFHRDSMLEIEGTHPQVLARCSRALAAIGARVTEMDLDAGFIRAKTGGRLFGLGERITILIEPTREVLYSIRLESDCRNPLALWDFGRNSANLRSAAEALLR